MNGSTLVIFDVHRIHAGNTYCDLLCFGPFFEASVTPRLDSPPFSFFCFTLASNLLHFSFLLGFVLASWNPLSYSHPLKILEVEPRNQGTF